MSQTHVLLINPDITSGLPVSFVIGRSGRRYAKSAHHRSLRHLGIKGISSGHVAKLTLDEYEEAVVDISMAGHRRGNRWIAKFLTEEPAAAVINYAVGYSLAERGEPLPTGASVATTDGYNQAVADRAVQLTVLPAADDPAPISKPQGSQEVRQDAHNIPTASASLAPATLPEVTPQTRYHALVKIAKDERVDLTGCVTNADRVERIIAARYPKPTDAV
jgi:hypothetical protein